MECLELSSIQICQTQSQKCYDIEFILELFVVTIKHIWWQNNDIWPATANFQVRLIFCSLTWCYKTKKTKSWNLKRKMSMWNRLYEQYRTRKCQKVNCVWERMERMKHNIRQTGNRLRLKSNYRWIEPQQPRALTNVFIYLYWLCGGDLWHVYHNTPQTENIESKENHLKPLANLKDKYIKNVTHSKQYIRLPKKLNYKHTSFAHVENRFLFIETYQWKNWS